jgi:hypothetical protein
VATQDANRQKALDPGDKSERVWHFQQNTVKALAELLAAAGLKHPNELGPEHIIRRIDAEHVQPLSAIYPQIKPGQLIDGEPDQPNLREYWREARADSFAAPQRLRTARISKLV